ncbi:MAG: NADPH-dependent FMN reductase [Gammaproteobacteria bacterium]
MSRFVPCIVGVGGTTRPDSSTEKALRLALAACERAGANTVMLGAADIDLPMYAPERPERSTQARRLVEALRAADGVVIASPGYHGSLSGLLKNALDYVEDLRTDARPYLEGRAVGCIVTAAGWQATATTLVALRSVVHALRGWPTPLGVTVNTAEAPFGADGSCASPALAQQMDILGGQVVGFALQGGPRRESKG